MNRLRCEQCPVRDSAACAALDEAERSELATLGKRRHLKKGETLFHAGDDLAHAATLVSGVLKISSHGEDGTERILSLVHPSGYVGEMFAPMARHDVVALSDSELCVFSRSDYERAIARFPALAAALLRRSAEDLYDARSLVELQARRDARGRVAAFLLSLARAASHSPCHAADRIDLPLSRGEMAGLLGLTIETASRTIGRLEGEGLIERDGPRGLRLLRPTELQRIAG